MTYEIGTAVYRATFEAKETTIVCPDCGGTKTLKVIIHDGTEYLIDCRTCESGWMGSLGYMKVYERSPRAEPIVIGGVEITVGRPVEYKYNVASCSWNTCKDEDVFATAEEAMARANETAAEAKAEETARIFRKEKDTKSWAWHVSYYRRMIKDAQEQIARAEIKLGIAKVKSKEQVA